MSDPEAISQSNSPPRRNLDRFATILKENKNKEKEHKEDKKKIIDKSSSKEEKSIAESISKISKSKVADNSYHSAKRSKKDPSLFKFEDGDSDYSSGNEISIKRNTDRNKPEIKSGIFKKIQINKNVIEQKREEEEERLRKAKLEADKKAVHVGEDRLNSSGGLLTKDENPFISNKQKHVTNISINSDTSNNHLKLNINTNKLVDTGEKKSKSSRKSPMNLSVHKDKEDSQELITNLKDKHFKDEMTGLLEKSFDQHFAVKRNLDEENQKVSELLMGIEKHDRKSVNLQSETDQMQTIDRHPFSHIISEEEFSNYEDYNARPVMHLDGYNRFYKGDFYSKEVFKEIEKETEMKIGNKDSMLFKSRLISNYFNEKTNVAFPKLTRMSEQEKKCQEILKFEENDIEEKQKFFYDRYCCFDFRKKYFRFTSHVSYWCRFIVSNPVFDNISLAIILINTMLILISDPTLSDSIANTTDSYFLYVYTVEMILKIFSFGFVLPDDAYIKDMWNIIDFFVVMVGWISFLLENAMSGNKISGLSGLRAFRILRPLKTVKSIKGLRSLIVTMIASMMALGDIAIVLFFFFLIFSIAGVQMWQGLCLKRCMSLNYGYFVDLISYTSMCTYDADCAEFGSPGNPFICAKSYRNPNNEVTHYDNTMSGLITVFIIATMEGWTDIWNYISRTFKDQFGINPIIIFIYFFVLLFVGGYYLINLYLAVIKAKFTHISRENINKDLYKKLRFFDLIEDKYKFKEKEQVESKKNLQIKEDEALKKLKSGYVFIKKNPAEIPIVYNTLNDILSIKTLTPEEQYKLSNKIKSESKNILEEYAKKVDKIKFDARSKNIANQSTNSSMNSTFYSFSHGKLKKRGSVLNKAKVVFKIQDHLIVYAIEDTLKWFKKDLAAAKKSIKNQKMHNNQTQISHQQKKMLKHHKREEERKKLKFEISVKQDTSIEEEIKSVLKPKKISVMCPDGSPVKIGVTEATTQDGHKSAHHHSRNTSNIKNKNNASGRNKFVNIEDELSFMSNNSEDDIEDYGTISKGEQDATKTENTNKLYSLKNSTGSYNETANKRYANSTPGVEVDKKTIMATIVKRAVLDEKEGIVNKVTFKKPMSMMSTILRHKDEVIFRKKIEEKRKRFNVDDYISQLKPVQINKLGRRRSFLNMLQYVEDTNSYNDFMNFGFKKANDPPGDSLNNMEDNNKSLEISLFHDDNLSNDSKSFSDQDMIPAKIPTDDRYIDEDLDINEINKKHINNKFIRLARKSMFSKNMKRNTLNLSADHGEFFFKKINMNMNDNIVIDMKEPKKGLRRNMTRKMTLTGKALLDPIKQEMNKSLKKNLKSSDTTGATMFHRKYYKTNSVEKNYYKYPQLDSKEAKLADVEGLMKMENEVRRKKEMIPNHLRERRRYFNYMNNIIDKDFAVQDVFKADYWREDVLGPTPKAIEQLKKPEERNPIYVFNSSSLNLKSYGYQRYRKYDILDEEYTHHYHKLKSLGVKAIEMFPPKSKSFGMIKSRKKKRSHSSEFPARPLSRSSRVNYSTTRNTSSVGSAFHKNKSVINKSSVSSVSHNVVQELFKVKKGVYDKVHRKLNEFNYRTFSHYFLNDERLVHKISQREDNKDNFLHQLLQSNEKTLEVKQQVEKIRIYDIETNSRRYIEWSGQDVLNCIDAHDKHDEWNEIIDKLEEFNVILWKEDCFSAFFQKFRYGFYVVSDSQGFDFFIISMVILNAVTMSLDGNMLAPETLTNIQISNYIFNAIFIAEFVIKFIGLGPILYFSDPFTYLDVFIIAFAILDMATPDNSSGGSNSGSSNISSQLGFLRVFRIFRVLRLTKVLRRIKAMRKIIKGIKTSLENVSYIILILLIFILIFQLLGMSLLNADPNYQSFMASFYITFQILSIENWNQIAFELMELNRLSILYLVLWIFLGNYILFNLFISVLLDSFDETEQDDDDEEEMNDYQRRIRAILPETFDKVVQAEKLFLRRQNMKKNAAKKEKKKGDDDFNNSDQGGNMAMSQSMATSGASDLSEEEDEEEVMDEEDEDDDENTLSSSAKILKKWEKENEIFAKNDCELSLYLFSQTSTFRIWVARLVEHKKFDHLILLMILLSTMRLILDTFISGYDSDYLFDMADIAFTLIFLFEMVSKIIAMGFILDNGSYLRDNWNKIDFVIVAVSIVDLQGLISKYSGELRGSSLNFLKVLRLLRLLRPLRFISHNVQLKLIITSLFDSIVPILNVLFVVLVVFFMFSIVGMNLFYDLYHSCYLPGSGNTPYVPVLDFSDMLITNNIPENLVDVQQFCRSMGGTMDASPTFKFSNLFSSLITCYVLSNMEGWPDIMNSYRAFNDLYGLFFVGYLIVVSYFILNLFVGIMFNCFNEAWNREKKKGISNNAAAEKYWDWLKQVEFAKPEFSSFKVPEAGMRKYLYKFASSKYLDNFIMIIIIMNMLLMAMSFEGADDNYNSILDTVNLVFTIIFVVECMLKLFANGLKGYFYHGWNQFDFFVVASSIVDIVISNTTDTNSSFLKSFQIIRVLRVLRVTRVLRLVKSLKGLEKLLQTLKWSMTALSNIFILMFLIFCIFAIMGCYLYDSIKYDTYKDRLTLVNEYFNFDNFYNSFMLCFRTVTGESWPIMMVELANVAPNVVTPFIAQIYMVLMNFITNVIMLNLFVLVTLQQFDEFNNKTENPIERFNELLDNFKKSWNKYSTDKDKGYKIKMNQVHDFLIDLEWSDLSVKKKSEDIKLYVMDLKLWKDHQNYVYFHDVLFKIIRREVGGKVKETISNIRKEEERLNKLIQFQINQHLRTVESNKTKVANPLNKFNPLTSHLYLKISFLYLKTFIENYKERNVAYLRENIENANLENMANESYEIEKINQGPAENSLNNKDDFAFNKQEIELVKITDQGEFEEGDRDYVMQVSDNIDQAHSLQLFSQNVSEQGANAENNSMTNSNSHRNSEDKLIIKENQF